MHNGAIELGNYFVQLSVDKRDDSEFQVAFAKCFINKPGSINLDELSKSKILSSILKNFGNDSIRAWILMLKGMMLTQEDIPPSDFQRIRCLQQIVHLIKSYTNNDQFLWIVGKFLFVYAYFDVSDSKRFTIHDNTKLDRFSCPLSEKLQKQFPDSFKTTFAHLGNLSMSGVNSQHDKLQQHIQVLTMMGDFIVTLLSKKKIKLISSNEQSLDNIKQTIEDLKAKIVQIDTLKEQSVESNIFKLLYLYFIVELFENSDEILSILPDFNECANRSLFIAKKIKKPKSDQAGEPLWADVLTDLLLSLLATKSKYTKNVIISAFKHISPFVSSVGMQSLTEAILNKDAFNAAESDDDIEDEEMELGEEETENGDKEESDEIESDSESDDDDDLMDVDDGQVDEQFKMNVIKALGNAIDKDDEDVDSDGMSDSEMFKIDDSLAEVFRQKYGEKKRENERQNMIQTFKHRVLEFILIVVEHKEMSLALTLEVLSSVLVATKSHYAIKNMSSFTHKCIQIFGLIVKKRFSAEESLDEASCRKVLGQLIDFQHKCSQSDLQKSLVLLTSWLLAVCKGQLPNSEMFHTSLTRSLRDFFDRSNVELKPELFTRLIPQLCEIEKKSFLKSDFYDTLLEYCFNSDIRSFKRCSAIDILCSLLKSCDVNNCQAQSTLVVLATRSISLLIDELNNLAETKQAAAATNKQIKLQYINLLMKLAFACKVFDSDNTKIAALLKKTSLKLNSTPKECRKKLNKVFVSKMKSVAL